MVTPRLPLGDISFPEWHRRAMRDAQASALPPESCSALICLLMLTSYCRFFEIDTHLVKVEPSPITLCASAPGRLSLPPACHWLAWSWRRFAGFSLASARYAYAAKMPRAIPVAESMKKVPRRPVDEIGAEALMRLLTALYFFT